MQEDIQRKESATSKWYSQRDLERRREYKEMHQKAKREVAKGKGEASEELYERLNTKEGKRIYTE